MTTYKKILGDTLTPVHIYMKLRDTYAGSILLESSDHKGIENSFSYICCNPYASFEVTASQIKVDHPEYSEHLPLENHSVFEALRAFSNRFTHEEFNLPFKTNGLFGYVSYDAVSVLKSVPLKVLDNQNPLILFKAFRNVIVVNHYHNEIYIFDHLSDETKTIDEIIATLNNRSLEAYPFEIAGDETSNFTDSEYLSIVEKGIAHCADGTLEQLVLSRKYQRPFIGDDFNVYRALRSINPSPYLFYFDLDNFKLFGSSPESQLVINDGSAHLFPIAGTYKRTGDLAQDKELAEKLKADKKENEEHRMLVDLAMDELRPHSTTTRLENYCQIEFFSHVIHLVSHVQADLKEDFNPISVLADTYPAGTLTGSPKNLAMQYIDQYENQNRGMYGGCVGMLGFDGSMNMAIIIRSFISQNNTLEYQAGAGIIKESIAQNELEEVHNKLRALRTAMATAETILDNNQTKQKNTVIQ